MKEWEIIADNLRKAGWSWGCGSAIDSSGRTIWIVDAHGYGKRFIVRAEEILDCVFGTGKGDSSIRGRFDLVKLHHSLKIDRALVRFNHVIAASRDRL